MAAGRPTEFNEAMLDKANEYLAWANDEKDEKGRLTVRLPKAAGLARHLGVHRATLYVWAEKHPEFNDILERLNQLQEERLIDKGLSGEYNSNIVKLALGKHGYHDKADIDHTTKGEKVGLSDEDRERLNKLFPPKEVEPDATGEPK